MTTSVLDRTIRLLVLALPLAAPAHGQIVNSKHDFSVTGAGAVKAATEDEICIFCHAPRHEAEPDTPLWNRSAPPPVYTPYSSSTLDAAPDQPTNASKLCLSCHDGTIARGSTLSRRIAMTGLLSGDHDLTTDLSDDHPISFLYTDSTATDPDLLPAAMLTGPVRLDSTGQMQCTSCHESHSSPYRKLLVDNPAFSALCLNCHDEDGWPGSIHESSFATWNGSGVDPWPHTPETTVAANACESCHDPHQAGAPDRLLNSLIEEDNCLPCHTGTVARLDIGAELTKLRTHAVDRFLGIHDPPEAFNAMARHVECVDCHNPHAATTVGAVAPNVTGALEGVRGVTAGGREIAKAAFEYEVCFRCHADNPNVPAPTITRQVFEPNLRLKFDTANPSYHPVAAAGTNPDVPSLIAPLTEASVIYCTDCHNSDDGPGASGTGPNGPHGSDWPFLLEREYRTADSTPESAQVYALCYKCHSRASLLSDEGFDKHSGHIGEASCSICHDPHGVRPVGPGDHTHLINFDTSIVFPDDGGRLWFEDQGYRTGRCYLRCHNRNHNGSSY